MTTATWSTRVRHDSDATFREWGSELSAKMAAVGLVQTADTGQINWTTVTRPGGGTTAGYEIWTFNDSLQASAPIYIKVEYGTSGSSATCPRVRWTVGTGSNGSGTLTGTALTTARAWASESGAFAVSDTARVSYMCHTEGFFGVSWKHGCPAVGGFFIDRTCDNTGTKTTTGAMVHWGASQTGSWTARQALRFAATAAAYTATTTVATGALGIMAQSPTVSTVGADQQVALGFTITPRAVPMNGVCGVYAAEFPIGNTFSVALVGSTAHTYLTMAGEVGNFGPVGIGSDGGMNIAMLYE